MRSNEVINKICLNKKEKGITLVALIITIIILLILAVVTISSIQNEGIIFKAEQSAFTSKVKKYEEELLLYINEKKLDTMFNYNESTLSADKTTHPSITDIIKSMDEKDASNFYIQAGKLVYIGADSQEQEWSGNLGVQVGKPLKRIYGNSIQNGTPSPESPVEIQSVGDKTKNLFNIDNITGANCTINGNSVDVKVFAENTSGSMGNTLKELCPELEVGKTYIISYDSKTKNTNISIGSYSTENYWKSGSKRTITETDLNATLRAGGGTVSMSETRTITFSNIQVEEGSTATEYEPYGKYKIPVTTIGENNEITTTNIYLDEPLRKVGNTENSADYIDFEKQQVIRRIKEVTISSLVGLQKLSDVGGYYRYEGIDNNSDKLFTGENTKNLFCTALSVITYPEYANNTIAERTNMNYIRILTKDYATLDELKSVIGDEIVLYALSTSDNTETIDLSAIKDKNVLSIGTQIQPSKIEK